MRCQITHPGPDPVLSIQNARWRSRQRPAASTSEQAAEEPTEAANKAEQATEAASMARHAAKGPKRARLV